MLVTLSVVLTCSVLFPGITTRQIGRIMAVCAVFALTGAGYLATARRRRPAPLSIAGRAEDWRMPQLAELGRASMSTGRKVGMGALRFYLAVASVLVVVKIVELALGR